MHKLKVWLLVLIFVVIVGCNSVTTNEKTADNTEPVLKIGYLPELW